LPIRHAGQAPNNSNEAKIAVAALTVVKFIYSEKTKKKRKNLPLSFIFTDVVDMS